MSIAQLVLLFFAALVGGAMNSVAGGGSFVAFPALLFTGVAPVIANATNSVALWPAGIAGAYAYRKDINHPRAQLVALVVASFIGGLVGALLLLWTKETTFVRLLPFLLLVATLAFTFGGAIASRRGEAPDANRRSAIIGITIVQLVISIYGGYFGGGMGIMMLATWSIMGMTNIHAMNGLKTLLGTFINGVAVAAFIIAGAVAWTPGIVMVVGGTIGGFAGASIARRIDPKKVKRFVLVLAWAMTAYFFAKTYIWR